MHLSLSSPPLNQVTPKEGAVVAVSYIKCTTSSYMIYRRLTNHVKRLVNLKKTFPTTVELFQQHLDI